MSLGLALGLPLVKTFQFLHIAYYSNGSKKIALLCVCLAVFLEQIESAARLAEFYSERGCHIHRFRQLLLFYHTRVVSTPREGT